MFRSVILVVAVLVLVSHEGIAQKLSPASGQVTTVQDEKLNQLTDQYRKMSQNNPEVDGYRVQIFFDSGSNSKNKAAGVKETFETAYPDVKSYLSYKEPYYRVRVGNFRTLTEAVGFQKKISAEYPNSFPVKDLIVQ
jgi:hypothetical protein